MSEDAPGAPPPPEPPPPTPFTPPPPPPYVPPPHGTPAYGAPYGYQGYAPPQTEGTAVAALVASIVSWVFCPLIPAIVALVLAPGAKRKIEQSGGRLTGLGLVTAAQWIAWINVALWTALALLAAVVIVIGGLADSGSSDFSSALVG
jgi:hypothetical protein